MFNVYTYALRRKRPFDLNSLWFAVAQGAGGFDGPTLLNLQHDDVIALLPAPNPRIVEGQLYCDNMRLSVAEDAVHDSLVLFEWTGCSYRSQLIGFWNYKPVTGSANCNWGDKPLMRMRSHED